jgi:hypothetical protein
MLGRSDPCSAKWRRRRDIIASKHGVGVIRIYDQINAYAPGHRVPAAEVREVFGVLNRNRNVSKGCAHHHCDIRAWRTGRVEEMDAVPTRVARRCHGRRMAQGASSGMALTATTPHAAPSSNGV